MNFYIKSFLIFTRIGAFTIGGGYAMVPLIENELVDKRKWISREDFLDLMALAQTVPGIFCCQYSYFHRIQTEKVLGRFLDGTGNDPSFFYHHACHCTVFPAVQAYSGSRKYL